MGVCLLPLMYTSLRMFDSPTLVSPNTVIQYVCYMSCEVLFLFHLSVSPFFFLDKRELFSLHATECLVAKDY